MFVQIKLSTIDCTKAIGLDDLHPRVLQLGAPFISQPLTYLLFVVVVTLHTL